MVGKNCKIDELEINLPYLAFVGINNLLEIYIGTKSNPSVHLFFGGGPWCINKKRGNIFGCCSNIVFIPYCRLLEALYWPQKRMKVYKKSFEEMKS